MECCWEMALDFIDSLIERLNLGILHVIEEFINKSIEIYCLVLDNFLGIHGNLLCILDNFLVILYDLLFLLKIDSFSSWHNLWWCLIEVQ